MTDRLFGSSFWSSMRNQPSPSIERLLEKKDQCNVDELIDDEDIIQEMRNGNEKLIKFLTRD